MNYFKKHYQGQHGSQICVHILINKLDYKLVWYGNI